MQQRKALDFIVGYQASSGGVSPSMLEVSMALGLASKSSAHRIVHELVEHGSLLLMPGKCRAMEVVGFRSKIMKAAMLPKPLVVFERARYFKFDDEEKRFVEWTKP